MKISELVEIIEKLEARNNSYWNFYTVVIIAVCGWVATSNSGVISSNTALALMFGNGLFYFMNLSIIYGTTSRIIAFESELIKEAQESQNIGVDLRQNLSQPMLAHRLKFTVLTHLVMDVAVLAFIYFGTKS